MTNADQTKSRGIPNDTENGVITDRPTTLSLFLASPDLISQLSLFKGDSGKQTVRPDGLLETDSAKDSAQSRKTTTELEVVSVPFTRVVQLLPNKNMDYGRNEGS